MPSRGKKKKNYWIYILQVSNGHYYTGYTNNLMRRYGEHLSGKGGCRYTRNFPPVGIKQCWRICEDQASVMKVESLIKSKSRKKKEEIVKNPRKLKKMVSDSIGLDLKIRVHSPPEIEKI